jgi:hypothetical protein
MDRRAAKKIGTAVSKAIEEQGGTLSEIAEAVGLTSAEMGARLRGDADFSAPQLVVIGGLVVVPSRVLLGAAA